MFAHDLSNCLSAKEGVKIKKMYLYGAKDSESLDLNTQDEILNGDDGHIFEKIPSIHPLLLLKTVKKINEWEPDIILLNGSRTLKYGAAGKHFFAKHVKLVYRVIDSVLFWNTQRYKQFYYRKFIMPKIDAAVGVSAASLRDMKSLHRFKGPSAVIHRAIDIRNFSSIASKDQCREMLGVYSKSKILLFLGNLTRQKRPDRFIRIISVLKERHPDVVAWIVGDGVLRNEVESLISEHKLETTVKLWGYQKHVGTFLASSDVLLLTSDTEGMPGVVLEAGYFGIPTVSTDVGGIRECIEDGKSGFIVSPDRTEIFIQHVHTLLENEKLRQEMGKEIRFQVNKSFTLDNVSAKYYDFFTSLLDKK